MYNFTQIVHKKRDTENKENILILQYDIMKGTVSTVQQLAYRDMFSSLKCHNLKVQMSGDSLLQYPQDNIP